MKAPPPRWRLAIGTHAPSPHQVLAMAMLGLAAAGASACSSDANKPKNETSKTAENEASAHLVTRAAVIMTKPSIPISTIAIASSAIPIPSSSRILATTSSIILATSDAKAEQSASLAAAARLSGKSSSSSSSPFSVSTRHIIAKDSINNVTVVTKPEMNINVFKKRVHNNINTKKSKNNQTDNNSEDGKNNDDNNNAKSCAPIDEDDSYPTFTQYHHSLLKQYLTPKVWAKLSHLQTSYGTTIEDLISAGLALPIGANPPRRVGVLVGDAECYTVFRELLDPIISEYHGGLTEEWMDPELPMDQYFTEKATPSSGSTSPKIAPVDTDYGVIKSSGADEDSDENDDSSFFLDEEDDAFVEDVALPSSSTALSSTSASANNSSARVATIASKRKGSLRRHSTIINNPRLVTNREADPEGKYIISTRIRIARSLDGVKFPPTMSRSDRRKVQRLIQDCTEHFQGPTLANGSYLPVLSMTNDQNLDLIERHILFDNPNEWTIASGLGRDWPDGRALYANVNNLQSQTPDFMIWVNEEDHLRIMCLRNGGDIQGVFTTLMNGIRELERELTKRNWHFAYDSRLGYLTSCPTNVGTTMRASVHVRLTNLGRLPGFFELVQRLKLEARGKYGETDRHYTGVFDISNAERLGNSEVHLINVMVEGVAKLIELERRLEAGEKVNIDEIARKRVEI